MLAPLLWLLVGSAASEQLAETTTPSPTEEEWAPATILVPHPYASPSTYVESVSGGGCLAHLKVRSTRTCYPQTVWQSTTSVNVGIDCNGCSQLSVSVVRGNCPMGGTHHPPSTTVTETPSTFFGFVCAATPTPTAKVVPSASVRMTDIEKILALPTLTSGQSPPYTPTALSAVYWPDGGCFAALMVAPTATGQAGKECEVARSTTYTSSVTSRIGINCGGCQSLNVIGEAHSCPEMDVPVSAAKVTASGPATSWLYECN